MLRVALASLDKPLRTPNHGERVVGSEGRSVACGVFVLRTISLFGSRVPATKASSTSYLSHLLTRLPFMSNTVQYVFMSVFELQDVRILPRSYYISGNVLRLRKVGITAAQPEFTSVAMPSGKRQRVAAKPAGGARPQMSRAQEPGSRPPARPLVLVTVWGSARTIAPLPQGKRRPQSRFPMFAQRLRK